MFGNTLPFRRQLEASTAPHAAPATASAQPAHVKFAVPSAVGEEANPLAVETSAVDKNDAAKPRDKQDATDANPNAMAPMIVLPGVVTPPGLTAIAAGGAALAPTMGTTRDPAGSALAPQTTDTPANDGLQSGSRNAVRSAPGLVSRGAIELATPASDAAKTAVATPAAASANSTPATPATPTTPATPASSATPVPSAPTPPAIPSPAAPRSEQATPAQPQNDPAARTAAAQALPTPSSAVGAAQAVQASGIAGLAGATPTATRPAQGSKMNATKNADPETPAAYRTPATNFAAALQRSIGDKSAPAQSNAPTAPAPAPMLTADSVAPTPQTFAQVVAQQSAPAQAATPAQPNLPTAATVPFDHSFGQRIGGAISAAMTAMAVKNGAILLQITPERFGRVEIEIDRRMERLQITTENEAVRGAIAQANGRIEHEMRQAGQRITTIDVATRDGAARHDGNGGSEQRNGQSNAQGNAQQSGGARPDQRNFSPNRGAPVRGESELQNPPSNVFYA